MFVRPFGLGSPPVLLEKHVQTYYCSTQFQLCMAQQGGAKIISILTAQVQVLVQGGSLISDDHYSKINFLILCSFY